MTTTTTNSTETVVSDQTKYIATGQLFHALASDPKYRREVLGLIKKAAPDTPIPELDLESTVLRTVEDRLKPATEDSKRIMDRLDSIDRKLTRDEWKNQHQLSEDEAVEVEEIAKTGKIGDSKVALELWQSRQALGTPRGTRKPAPGTDEYLKNLGKVNPRNQKGLRVIAEKEASRIFSTFQRKAS